jgi:probable phosphoglycerate mutase
MSAKLPQVYLVRHGETAWTLSRQHTGLTDIPLTENGERGAKLLGENLKHLQVARVFTSPLQRAKRTCELAGFGDRCEIDAELVEWDYGDFEGLTTAEIRKKQPDWNVFRHGCPGGESVQAVGERADRVIGRMRKLNVDVLVFSSGHFSRVLAARWLKLDAGSGALFALNTATLSILGYEHDLEEPVLKLWNDAKPSA